MLQPICMLKEWRSLKSALNFCIEPGPGRGRRRRRRSFKLF